MEDRSSRAGVAPSSNQFWTLDVGPKGTAQMRKVEELCVPSRAWVHLVEEISPGAGVFGPSKSRYALKEIPRKDEAITEEKLQHLARLLNLQHDNVLKYLHVQIEKCSVQYTSPLDLVILMEWCQVGTLAKVFNIVPAWSLVHQLSRDMLAGIDYIHKYGIIHGDIKPDNIFLAHGANNDVIAKVGDLDDSVALYKDDKNVKTKDALVGTCMYRSPERLSARGDASGRSTKGFTTSIDIWSFGCTVLFLASRAVVYFLNPQGEELKIKKDQSQGPAQNGRELEAFLQNGGRPWVPNDTPALLRSFIQSCIAEDPHNRPDASKLLSHPWMKWDACSREINGFCQKDTIIKLRSNYLLPVHVRSEKELGDTAWSNSANCAVRILAHFQAPKFRLEDADRLIHECPKGLDPQKPFDPKYIPFLKTCLKGLYGTGMIHPLALAILEDEEERARFTRGLQPVGAPFPLLVTWLNTFEHEYEYTVKDGATWSDIKEQLDEGFAIRCRYARYHTGSPCHHHPRIRGSDRI
ncbi:uncharacterized protein LOC129584277 isoform X2 [Paramacrobiotus metropolitanus]|uniref:uncharacterized protein LOC129584277 isoform X2 n=1 Tax=Paramacrobiotus metropolitanus TaxID=2943436 RepID=UPI002445BBEC|nr:uncharacterized protein LOC129584277 isoform X2 [Paramacrobiotus metropolitanus]